MQIKPNLILRDVCGVTVVTLPRKKGDTQGTVVQFNDTSAFLFRAMQPLPEFTAEDMVAALLSEYETDEATVRPWCIDLCRKWQEAGLTVE